ncbi:hypothetical protein D046_9252, partial [Vibrio parahaemolyticus V-223/04]
MVFRFKAEGERTVISRRSAVTHQSEQVSLDVALK